MSDVISPQAVDKRLKNLGDELDEAHRDLDQAERVYMQTKTAFELASAKARMGLRNRALDRGVKITVAEVDDQALIDCEGEYTAMNTAEAVVRATRANNARIRVQIDIARSIGTNVRTSMNLA